MAAHRYWRLTGFRTNGIGALELTEARLYAAGAVVDAAATLSCTLAPSSGTLTDLKDGLTTGVVAWPFVAHSSSGFALTWDLTSSGASVDAVRLGSGGSQDTYPVDLTLQCSDDAAAWTTSSNVVGTKYPGDFALTQLSSDPNISHVSLFLDFDGVDGSTTFSDRSPAAVSVTRGSSGSGSAQVGTASTKFGTGALALNGGPFSEAWLDASGQAFGTADFTLEFWAYTKNHSQGFVLTDNRLGGTADSLVIYESDAAGTISMYINGANRASTSTPVATNSWCHYAVCRKNAVTKFFLNGVQQGADYADTNNYSGSNLRIGSSFLEGNTLCGYIDEVRVTKGVARYTANFIPQNSSFNLNILPIDSPPPSRIRSVARVVDSFPGSDLPVGSARSNQRENTFFDAYNGGLGIHRGTVKRKHDPSNTPWRRKILLIDEASQLVIRQTWSDSLTGAYEFRGIRLDAKYTALAYDHTGELNAVVASNQSAEPMPLDLP